MAYIGREPTVGNFQVCDDITVVNGQATYTMQVSSVNVLPESANHCLVSLNGVLQKSSGTSPSFTISGSTITFASNLVTGDVINFIHILGSVLDLGVPSDSTVSLAKLTATGTKSSSTFLRGDNTFAAAGGGKIGQVVSTAKVDTFSTSSSSFTDITGLSVTITPSATNSKIYVMTNFQGRSDSGSGYPSFRMLRGSTLINSGTTAGSRVGGFLVMNVYNADSNTGMSISTAFLDSPSTTDATTYKIQMKQSGGNTAGVGSGGNDTDGAAYVRSASVITVMEVLA